jgi:hypothetical protein
MRADEAAVFARKTDSKTWRWQQNVGFYSQKCCDSALGGLKHHNWEPSKDGDWLMDVSG